jgi:hypothetical protein
MFGCVKPNDILRHGRGDDFSRIKLYFDQFLDNLLFSLEEGRKKESKGERKELKGKREESEGEKGGKEKYWMADWP